MARVCLRPEIVEPPKDEKTPTASVLNVTKTPIPPPAPLRSLGLSHPSDGGNSSFISTFKDL